MLGYDVYEDNRDFVQEGLTGTVRRYVTEDMKFPCYIVVFEEDNPIEKYKIEALQKMFILNKSYDEESVEPISIYFNQGSKTVRFGQITALQVKAFLSLFNGNHLEGYFDKDTHLTGDLLYVLA